MIDLRRIILHGYLGYAAPRNIIDVNSRKATARGHKENVETRYRVASTRFSGFPPVNLPRFVAASLAMDTLVTAHRDIKCPEESPSRVYLAPLNVCFFAIFFQRMFIASKSPFFRSHLSESIKFDRGFDKIAELSSRLKEFRTIRVHAFMYIEISRSSLYFKRNATYPFSMIPKSSKQAEIEKLS